MNRDFKTYARAICRHRNGNDWADSPDRKRLIKDATALLKAHQDRITPWEHFRLNIDEFLLDTTGESPGGACAQRSKKRPHDADDHGGARKKQDATPQDCCVCLEAVELVIFAPCGHQCACNNCCANLRQCPLCRARIESTITTVFSA